MDSVNHTTQAQVRATDPICVSALTLHISQCNWSPLEYTGRLKLRKWARASPKRSLICRLTMAGFGWKIGGVWVGLRASGSPSEYSTRGRV